MKSRQDHAACQLPSANTHFPFPHSWLYTQAQHFLVTHTHTHPTIIHHPGSGFHQRNGECNSKNVIYVKKKKGNYASLTVLTVFLEVQETGKEKKKEKKLLLILHYHYFYLAHFLNLAGNEKACAKCNFEKCSYLWVFLHCLEPGSSKSLKM